MSTTAIVIVCVSSLPGYFWAWRRFMRNTKSQYLSRIYSYSNDQYIDDYSFDTANFWVMFCFGMICALPWPGWIIAELGVAGFKAVQRKTTFSSEKFAKIVIATKADRKKALVKS